MNAKGTNGKGPDLNGTLSQLNRSSSGMANGSGQSSAGSVQESPVIGQAVFFFQSGRIVSELRLPEFQSLVGGVAMIEQFAGKTVDSVYVEVGLGLNLKGLAFFRISFDERGIPVQGFSIPFAELLQRAALGPDFGSGRIRLACRTQCPIPWVASQLWQPRSTGPDGECAAVQRALWKNRLGFRGAPAPPKQGPAADPKFNETMSVNKTGQMIVPEVIRQFQSRVGSLEEERDRIREQLRSAKTEIARLTAELGQERDRAKRLEQLLRGPSI